MASSLTLTVSARLNSIRFVALRKFLREVANYMAELRVMHGLVSEAAHKVARAATEAMETLKKNGMCNQSHVIRVSYQYSHVVTLQ